MEEERVRPSRPMRCFSPERTPGVSMKLMCCRTGALHNDAWNLFRKVVPNLSTARKGMSAWMLSALLRESEEENDW